MSQYPRYPPATGVAGLPPPPPPPIHGYNDGINREYQPAPYPPPQQQQQYYGGSSQSQASSQSHGLPPLPHQSYGNQGNGSYSGMDGNRERDRGIPPPAPMRDYGDRGGGRGGGGGGRGGRRGRSPDGPAPRRWLDETEKLQESIFIADRRAKEKQCRTLFLRNVSYEADSRALRQAFEQFGEIKTWFDLITKRGMAFITYYDLRAAERAQQGMNNTKVEGRTMDVHYSLPRVEDMQGQCDREKGQGSLSAGLRGGRQMNVDEFGRMASRFGDIRNIKPGPTYAEQIIEFFDTRAVPTFFDEMNDKPFAGGVLVLKFIWDDTAPPVPSASLIKDQPRGGTSNNRGRGGSAQRNGEGRPGGGGGRGSSPDRRRDPGYGRDGGRRESYPPGPPPDRYSEGPRPPPVQDDRLEQARKVQELLANLAGPPVGQQPPLPPTQSQPPYQQQNQNRYPTNGYSAPPPQPPTNTYGQPSTNPPGYPPNQGYPSNSYSNPPPPRSQSNYPPNPTPPSSYPPQNNSYNPPPSSYPSYPPLHQGDNTAQRSSVPGGYGLPPIPQAAGYGGPPGQSAGYNPSGAGQGQGQGHGQGQGPPATYGNYGAAPPPQGDVSSLLNMLRK